MKLVSFSLLFLALALAGCAATESTSLAAMQHHQVRSLAMACYRENDGFRLVYASHWVWAAGKVQAERKVGRSHVVWLDRRSGDLTQIGYHPPLSTIPRAPG